MRFVLRSLRNILIIGITPVVVIVVLDILLRYGLGMEDAVITAVTEPATQLAMVAVCYCLLVSEKARSRDNATKRRLNRSSKGGVTFRILRPLALLLMGYCGIVVCYLFSNLPEIWRGTHDFTSLLPYLKEESMVVLVFSVYAYSRDAGE